MQVQRISSIGGPVVRIAPLVWTYREVTNTRFCAEFARVFEPMIKPAQQNLVGVQISFFAESGIAHSIAPRNMHPWTGDQILVVARELAACVTTQFNITCNRSFEISIEPACDVQSGNLNALTSCAYVLCAPVLAGLTMRKPVAHVIRQRCIGDNGMSRVRCKHRLCTDIGPGCLKLVAGLTHSFSSRIFAQHLNAPTKCGTEVQCTVMVEPAVI